MKSENAHFSRCRKCAFFLFADKTIYFADKGIKNADKIPFFADKSIKIADRS